MTVPSVRIVCSKEFDSRSSARPEDVFLRPQTYMAQIALAWSRVGLRNVTPQLRIRSS